MTKRSKKKAHKSKYESLNDDPPPSPQPSSKASKRKTKDNSEQSSKGRRSKNEKSNKKRSHTPVAFNDDEFRRALEEDGSKSIIEMASDGNCLFRSISDQLFHDFGSRHEEVREDVCDFIEANEDDYCVFLVLDDDEDDDEDASSFEEYVANMRENGEWGGNLELVAAARLYRRNIKVFSLEAAYTIDHGAKQSLGPDLIVSYHDNDHYNSVRDNNVNKKVPPSDSKKSALHQKQKRANNDGQIQEAESRSSKNHDNKHEKPRRDKTRSPQRHDKDENGDRRKEPSSSSGKTKKKKSGPCPCGSGKSYRKCCRDKDKEASRRAKRALQEQHPDSAEAELCAHKETALIENGFRVMSI